MALRYARSLHSLAQLNPATCCVGYYTFTRNSRVHNAQTGSQLLSAIAHLPATPQRFATSWDLFDLPVVYLAGVAQNHPNNAQQVLR